jgi:signal peptidase I
MRPRVIRFFLILSAAILLGILLESFQPLRITSNSMAENLKPGDYVVVSRMGNFLHNRIGYSLPYARGEVVATRAPDGVGIVVKRVAGVEGDRLRIQAGKLILNGAEVAEPYVDTRPIQDALQDSWPRIVTPQGYEMSSCRQALTFCLETIERSRSILVPLAPSRNLVS